MNTNVQVSNSTQIAQTHLLGTVVKNFDTTYLIPKSRVGEFYDNVERWCHFRRNGLFDKIWGGFLIKK